MNIPRSIHSFTDELHILRATVIHAKYREINVTSSHLKVLSRSGKKQLQKVKTSFSFRKDTRIHFLSEIINSRWSLAVLLSAASPLTSCRKRAN
jgi:hypothetical protein